MTDERYNEITQHEYEKIIIDGEVCRIDIPCVPMVKFFNSIGMKTQFCCQGDKSNKFHIIFDRSVSDKDMIHFISEYSNKYDHSPFLGKFSKWCRKASGEIVCNWMYEVKSIEWAVRDLNTFKDKNSTMSKINQESEK